MPVHISALQSLPSLHITAIPLSPQLSLLGDGSTKTFRPLIPIQFQRQVFHHIHSNCHPGINATQRLISACFVWAHNGQGHHRMDTPMHCQPESQNLHSHFTSAICHSRSRAPFLPHPYGPRRSPSTLTRVTHIFTSVGQNHTMDSSSATVHNHSRNMC
jgi:hypothetical protein